MSSFLTKPAQHPPSFYSPPMPSTGKTPLLPHRPDTVGPRPQAPGFFTFQFKSSPPNRGSASPGPVYLLQAPPPWTPPPGLPLDSWVPHFLPNLPLFFLSAPNFPPFLLLNTGASPSPTLLHARTPTTLPQTPASRPDYSNPTTNFLPRPAAFRLPSCRGASRVVATALGIPTHQAPYVIGGVATGVATGVASCWPPEGGE